MNDPLEIITDGCFLALRFGMQVSPTPPETLAVRNGQYWLDAAKTYYHPLEPCLIGCDATGDWRQDVANFLGVNAQWIDGFCDGFEQQPERSTDGEYTQGWLTAEELRLTRYRKHLPDRQ